ncbi:serine-type D-Ala-D-Ala carboxypeptidase [Photobacterium nomapromontoriensis]|uniref:serine-type D-Ala-D-Ala carboxypeptidase n=1 Tax=Photobacterium nomapromontoriensis TaxID=2910237 RepID=UPI003D09ABC9
MLRFLLAPLSLCFSLLASAATSNLPSPDFSALPNGNDSALVIVDTNSGDTLFQQRADQLQPPASIQKMLTALAAKLYLNNDFQFETTLAQRGNDIVINFSGDPTLSRQQLSRLLGQLKKHGITTIKGNILLNGSQFNGNEQAPGWPWDILGVCYSAPSSSLSLEHNCVQGALYSNQAIGQLTRVNVPSHQPITVTTEATITDKEKQRDSFCELNLTTQANNNYLLSGCLAQRDKPLPLNFAVQDTEAYISQTIASELKRLGIRHQGKIYRDDTAAGTIIARHHSATLNDLLNTMIKDSDNLIADNLTKTLGGRYFNQTGNYANGTAAIKAILRDKAGINLDNAVLVDGSGLSRNNRLTANQIMEVLTYIDQHDKTLGLLDALPVSGESGTLRYRQSIRHQPLQGKIQAKSGSLYGTYNLAGLIKTQSGHSLLFVQMITNYHPVEPADDTVKAPPAIETFERSLYQTLYNHY